MKKIIRVLFINILVLVFICLSGCTNEDVIHTIYLDEAFSVAPYVNIYSSDKFFEKNSESITSACNSILKDLDSKYDVDSEDSLLFKVNKNASSMDVEVDEEFALILSKALETSSNVSEDYDISIYSLTFVWGFKNKYFKGDNYFNAPSKETIDNAKALVNYENIKLKTIGLSDGNKYYVHFEEEGMKIDLGSIVKGYACDKLAKCLKQYNVENAIINIGGNVYTFGSRSYNVGITTPFYENYNDNQSIIGKIKVENKNYTFVTSGTYERYIKDTTNTMYHHILDKNTGYPIANDLVSVTIVKYSEDDSVNISIDADALSTAIFTLGLTSGLNYVETHEGIEAVFVTTANQVVYSSGLSEAFTYNSEVTSCGFSVRG